MPVERLHEIGLVSAIIGYSIYNVCLTVVLRSFLILRSVTRTAFTREVEFLYILELSIVY